VIDRLIDKPQLAVINLEVPFYLGAQALGVDDDRVRQPSRSRVIKLSIDARHWHN